MSQKITVAYSPDTDDAFMMEALRTGAISHLDFTFEFVTGDIQELNEAAKEGRYDITAISVAAYPQLVDTYLMMPVGASIGDTYGPAVVVAEEGSTQTVSDLKGKKVAVPGSLTSAYLAAQGVLPEFEPLHLPFDQIAGAVKDGTVNAGILIHELQIGEEAGIRKIADLGTLWRDKFDLPLPLGANAIKRNIGEENIRKLTKLLQDSIVYGLEHRQETLLSAIAAAKPGLDPELGDRYISMYVNQDTVAMGDDVLRGVEKLFDLGHQLGLTQGHSSDALMGGVYSV